MTIRDLFAAESINLNGTPAGKTEALNQCIDLMAKSGKIADVEKYRKGVFAREEEGTTGIGMGIAIPHCKSDAVTKAGLAAMVCTDKAKLVDSITQLISNQEIQKKYYEQAIVMTREHHNLQASCKTSENVVAKAIQHMK